MSCLAMAVGLCGDLDVLLVKVTHWPIQSCQTDLPLRKAFSINAAVHDRPVPRVSRSDDRSSSAKSVHRHCPSPNVRISQRRRGTKVICD
jgi:hypothetical protein